jgi:Uncharacterized protein conserved in bacteria (DUF2188)
MGFDQKGTSVFCVEPGAAGQWVVKEEGFEKPLALFDTKEEAREYADDIARTKAGSQIKVKDDPGQRAVF